MIALQLLRKTRPRFLFIAVLAMTVPSHAILPSGISYHGRLIESDGVTPVAGSVTFDIQIKSPDGSNCILYEETQNQNLDGAKGIFALTLNDGSGTRIDAAPQMPIDDVFSNRVAINHSCSGGAYAPHVGDGRILKVTFQGAGMMAPEPMPDQMLNFAPLAIEAKQVSGYAAENILRFENADHSLFNTSPLNNTQYDELVRLVNGTSLQYAPAAGAANGTPIYASATGTIGSTTNGDMWLDTSASGSVDVLKINTRSGIQEIALSPSGSFINAITQGTGMNVTTTAGTATVAIANGGVGTAQLGDHSVTSVKLDSAINVATTGYVSAHALAVANSLPTPNVVGFAAPASAFTNYTLVLPSTPGISGQVLKTDGAGNLSWTDAAAGALTATHIFVGNAAGVAADVALTGDAAIDASGALKVTGLQGVGIGTTAPIDGQVLVYSNGANKWQPQNFSIGSLRTAIGGTQFSQANCSASQTLTWSSLTDAFSCTTIGGLDAAAIASGTIDASRLPANTGDWANSGNAIHNTNSGNVGIGTTAPLAKLQVIGNELINTTGATAAFTYDALDINAVPYSGNASAGISVNSIYNGIALWSTRYGMKSNSNGDPRGAIDFTFRDGSTNAVVSSVEALSFNSSGAVGIGTTAPAYKLDVAGDINTNGALRINGTAISASGSNLWTQGSPGSYYSGVGNVGIGTSTPSVKLDIAGALGLSGKVSTETTLSSVVLPKQGAFIGWNEQDGNGYTHFMNGRGLGAGGFDFSLFDESGVYSLTALTIYYNGNVGIGTTAPAAKLDVVGAIRLEGTTAGYAGFQAPASMTTSTVWTLPAADGSANQVLQTNGSGILSWASASAGSVTSVSSATTDIAVSMSSPTPVLTLNSGTGAGQILKLNSSSQIPAVDGSLITNVSAANIGSGILPVARGGTGQSTFANYAVIASNSAGNQVAVPGATSNTMLQWSLTGPAWSSATYPSTTTANQLLYSSAANVVGGLTTANNGVLQTDALGVPSFGSTLPSAVQGNITSTGTLTSGTWNGNAIAATYGGTGQTSFAVGDLLYASSTSALSRLPASTPGYVLTSTGAGSAPSWQTAGTSSQWTTHGSNISYDGSGNVGIGTTSPSAKLEVSGTVLATGLTSSGGVIANGTIYSGGYNGTAYTPSGALPGQPIFNASNYASAGTWQSIGLSSRSSNNDNQYAYMGTVSTPTGFEPVTVFGHSTSSTDYVERMRIDSNGRVGIGSTAPPEILSLDGGANAGKLYHALSGPDAVTKMYRWTGVGSNYQPWYLQTGTAAGGVGFSIGGSSSAAAVGAETTSPYMTFIPGGNVGIGTTAPAARLDVSGAVSVRSSYEGASALTGVSTTYAIPDSSLNIRRLTLNSNTSITLPAFTTPSLSMYTLTVFVTQDSTGSRTLAWAAQSGDTIKWDLGTVPTYSTGASKTTIYQFTKASDDTVWYGSVTWKEN